MPFRTLHVGLALVAALAFSILFAPARGAFAGDSMPLSETITAIEFTGAKSISESSLREMIKSKEGSVYDTEKVSDDIKALGAAFRDVEARRVAHGQGVKLIFVLSENPEIKAISFVGNSKFSEDRLKSTLKVKVGDTLGVNTIVEARDRVMKLYQSAGHTGAKVRVETIANPDASVSLQIFIDEGQRLKVDDLRILGAKNVSSKRIRMKMENKGSWWFFDNYFSDTGFQEDLQKIRQLYLGYGYFDVDVRPGEFEYKDEKVTPVILINEGPRYSLGEVKVEGATYFNALEIQAPFADLKGKAFDADKFNEAEEKVKNLYFNEGFLLTQIEEEPELIKDKGIANFTLNVTERDRVRVGTVEVERTQPVVDDEEMGFFSRFYAKVAPPVKDEAIKREITLNSGDVYRKSAEEESVQRLESLGVFEDVRVHSEPTSQEDVRNLVIEVDEGVTGNLVFGVGYGDATGAFVFGAYTERNLFGEAKDFRARAMIGTKSITANIGYLDRYWQEDGTSLAVDLYKTGFSRPGFDEDELGATAEIGKPINEYMKMYIQGRVGYIWLDPEKDVEAELNDYPVATARLRMVRNLTDNNTWPTSGNVISGGVEAGYADGALVKLTGRYAQYKSLGKDWIYAMNAEGGLMPFDASQVGITERFFLGGTDDLRGFAFRGAGPKDSGNDKLALGGSTKFLLQNELRFNLLDDLGISPRATPLRGLVFADVGMLGEDAFEIGSPRASIGAGVRLDMKQISLGFDLALPVISQDEDDKQFLHFKVSSAF